MSICIWVCDPRALIFLLSLQLRYRRMVHLRPRIDRLMTPSIRIRTLAPLIVIAPRRTQHRRPPIEALMTCCHGRLAIEALRICSCHRLAIEALMICSRHRLAIETLVLICHVRAPTPRRRRSARRAHRIVVRAARQRRRRHRAIAERPTRPAASVADRPVTIAAIADARGVGGARGAAQLAVVVFVLDNVRTLDHARDQLLVRLLERALDEAGRHEVGAHVDVFAQVEAFFGRAEPQFDWFAGLAGEVAADGPFFFDVETQGRVDVGLEAVGEVVEAGVVGDVPLCESPGQILYFVRELIPYAVVLFGASEVGRFALEALDYEGIEIDHFEVVMKSLYNRLSSNAGRQRSYVGCNGSFRHGVSWTAQ